MSYANYQSGWCVACGRRRGNDGRCVNCDPWWTSGLVQVGGPIIAVGMLLMTIVLVTISPTAQTATHRVPSQASSGRVSGMNLLGSPALGGPSSPLSSLSAPSVQTAYAPLPPILVAPSAFSQPLTEDQRLFNDLTQLRSLANTGSAAMRSANLREQGQALGTKFATPVISGSDSSL